MEEKKVKVEVTGKGGGQPFHRQNFKKKEPIFKPPKIGLETIVFSYGQPKDAVAFIKWNKALYKYGSIKFIVIGTTAVRDVISFKEPYLKLTKDPGDTTGKVAFLMGNVVQCDIQEEVNMGRELPEDF